MDFSDDKHSLSELVFQGASEIDPMPDVGDDARNALMAWQQRPDPHASGAELLRLKDCSVFSISYDGQAGDYWPNESENLMTETLIRDFLYRDGICSLTDDHIRLICMKYQVMALADDEHVVICPYLTEAGNISGIVVVCATKMMHKLERTA